MQSMTSCQVIVFYDTVSNHPNVVLQSSDPRVTIQVLPLPRYPRRVYCWFHFYQMQRSAAEQNWLGSLTFKVGCSEIMWTFGLIASLQKPNFWSLIGDNEQSEQTWSGWRYYCPPSISGLLIWIRLVLIFLGETSYQSTFGWTLNHVYSKISIKDQF